MPTGVQLGVDFTFFLIDRANFFQKQNDPLALVHFIFAGVVLLDGFDHVLKLDAVLLEVFAHVYQLFHGHRHFDQGVQ